ncbi:MAG: tetratricopeptide repeat protein [Oscillatoriales cyanobacterium SM2_2_1]|nr:tetratricopeptide repeat protein [Oscillatoriales cyanobacterium SM2_2_1]
MMVTAQYQEALQAYAEGRYEEAMRQFSELLYEDAKNPKLHIWLGATHRKLGRLDEAKEQYQQVLSLTDDPDLIDLAKTSLAQIQSSNQFATTTAVPPANLSLPQGIEFNLDDEVDITEEHQGLDLADALFQTPDHTIATGAPTPMVVSTASAVRSAVSSSQGTASVSPPGSSLAPAIEEPTPIAIEDLFRFSGLKPRITAFVVAIATVPAVFLGTALYQSGNQALTYETRQNRQAQLVRDQQLAESLARTAHRHLQSKDSEAQSMTTLLSTGTENLGRVPLARQQAFWNQRLSLYRRVYPAFSAMAIYSINGNLIAQRATDPQLPSTMDDQLRRNLLKAETPIVSIISAPVVFKQPSTYGVFIAALIQNPRTKRTSHLAVVRLPLSGIREVLERITDVPFTMQTSTIPNLIASSAEMPVNAVTVTAPLPFFTNASFTDWQISLVATPEDNAPLHAARQVLLLILATGVALTPLLAGLLAFSFARGLAQRLLQLTQQVRHSAQQLVYGKFSEERLSEEGDDEIAQLAVNINHLLDQVQSLATQQQQEQRKIQQQSQKLFKSLRTLAQVQDENMRLVDENIQLVVRKVEERVQSKEVEALKQRQEKEQLQNQLAHIFNEVKELANGDLTVTATLQDGEVANVSEFFNRMVDGLQQIVSQVKSSAAQVQQSLGQNERAITQLSGEAMRQADELVHTLNATQMLAISAQSVANNSKHATDIVHQAAAQAATAGKSIELSMQKVLNLRSTVTATAKKVQRLSEASQRVARVMAMINEIAVQTNFLAINASLESARTPDEQHRNLARLSQEVGELAKRSSNATQEVEALLHHIQTDTAEVMAVMAAGEQEVMEGTKLVESAQQSLGQIMEVTQQIDTLIATIQDATMSQATASECVATLIQEISQVSRRTVDSSTEVSRSLHATVRSVELLQRSVMRFKLAN